MRKFFGAKTRLARKNHNGRRLGFEGLEQRQLLAGIPPVPPMPPAPPASMPLMLVRTNAMPVSSWGILPGSQKVEVADLTISAKRLQGQLEEIIFTPGFSSVPFDGNLYNVVLMADMNGKAGDGCEKTLAQTQVDQNGILDFVISRSVWVTSKGLHVEVYANISNWPQDPDNCGALGLEVNEAFFRNVRNAPVPEDRVTYQGDAALLPYASKLMQVSQWQTANYASVNAGQTDVRFMDFSVYCNSALVSPGTATATISRPDVAHNFSLWVDTNYNNQIDPEDACVQSGIEAVGGKLTLNLDGGRPEAHYMVQGDISYILPTSFDYPVTFKMSLETNGTGFSATDLENGKPLRGIVPNGKSVPGQIQVYSNPSNGTLFTVVHDVVATVKELSPAERNQTAQPGQQGITLEAFTIYAPSVYLPTMSPLYLASVTIEAKYKGDLGQCEKYALWSVHDDGTLDRRLADGRQDKFNVIFDGFLLDVSRTGSVRMEVRADVKTTTTDGWLQVGLAGNGAVRFDQYGQRVAMDCVFAEYSDQTSWRFGPPYPQGVGIDELLAQIAMLQAQLATL